MISSFAFQNIPDFSVFFHGFLTFLNSILHHKREIRKKDSCLTKKHDLTIKEKKKKRFEGYFISCFSLSYFFLFIINGKKETLDTELIQKLRIRGSE